MKFNLITLFWTDGKENSTRERNLEYSWSSIKKLTKYLKENNVECDNFLFDFSPSKLQFDSIHIPFSLGVYLRSKKLNLIINSFDKNEVLFIFDCDTFFIDEDFPKILLSCNLSSIEFYDVASLTAQMEPLII
jgi:hypothetical protein